MVCNVIIVRLQESSIRSAGHWFNDQLLHLCAWTRTSAFGGPSHEKDSNNFLIDSWFYFICLQRM